MTYNPKDRFFHKAKEDGFVARSAYKLQEIQKKYNIIKPGQRVMDLGASPGSWSQVASKIVGPNGMVIGIDLTPIAETLVKKLPNVRFITADAFTITEEEYGSEPLDVILSDMAPKTTGIRVTDLARSEELCYLVLGFVEKHLKKGGHMVMKNFDSPDTKGLTNKMQSLFTKVHKTKPEAVRKGSFETFLIGLAKK